jgi:SET domain
LLSLHSNSSLPDELIDKLHSELASLFPANIAPLHFSRENTSSLISKEKNNSFELISPIDPKYAYCGVTGVGAYGLYLWASMLNHNCMPNVCGFDYVEDLDRENNTDLVFRALHEIKEGSEICISYVGVRRGYRERQKRLMEIYGFKCECERCKIESQWKENQGEEEEEETEEEIEQKNEEDDEVTEEEEVELGEEESEMSQEGDGFFLIDDYIKRYICYCGGFLAPMPPSQNGVLSNLIECNGCGNISKDEPGDAGNAST